MLTVVDRMHSGIRGFPAANAAVRWMLAQDEAAAPTSCSSPAE
jgi:hypothetical protein